MGHRSPRLIGAVIPIALGLAGCEARTRSIVTLEGASIGDKSFSGDGGDASSSGDGPGPKVTLSSPPARVRGGSAWQASVSLSSERRVVAFQLQYASDGDTLSDYITIDPAETSATWTFERSDVAGARFRLIAMDDANNLGWVLSDPFAVDSTGPVVPDFSTDVPLLTNQRHITLRLQSCTDTAALYLSESSTAPLGDPLTELWQPCVAGAARAEAPGITLDPGDGLRTFHVWASDEVGNPSATSRDVTLTLDTTSPVVTLHQPVSGGLLGSGQAIVWTSSDLHLLDDSAAIEVGEIGGVPIAASLPVNGSWVPMGLVPGSYPVRVSVSDAAGNVGSSDASGAFTYDPVPPQAPSVTVVSGDPTHSVDVALAVLDCGDRPLVFVSEATAAPAAADPGWQSCLSLLPPFQISTGEGAHTLYVWAQDAAGNVSLSAGQASTTLDLSPPDPPPLMLTSDAYSAIAEIFFDVLDCTDRPEILVEESAGTTPPLQSDLRWETCATAQLLPLSAGDGSKTARVWAKDAAGNVSSTSSGVSMTLDTEDPMLTILAPTGGQAIAASTSFSVAWSAYDPNLGETPIRVQVSETGGPPFSDVGAQPIANTSPFSWTVPSTGQNDVQLLITATDLAGHSKSVVVNVIISSEPPVFALLRLNGETTPPEDCESMDPTADDATTPYGKLELQVEDPIGANVTHLCIKTKSATRPQASDSCFQPIQSFGKMPAPQITLDVMDDISIRLGYVNGPVVVRVWSKNEVGLVSNLSGAGALGRECYDRRSISLDLPPPPVVSNVTSFVKDQPLDPYAEEDVLLDGSAEGSKVYIKWHAVIDNGYTSPPISLEYTDDDVNYTKLSLTLDNAQNGACTFDPAVHTGCYEWTPPSELYNQYLKVRVRATDKDQISSVSSSMPPLNTQPIRFLAGNPDPGYGGNAASTLFVNHLTRGYWDIRLGTFAVSARGVIYFLDQEHGIQWVDPSTGNVDTLVHVTGVTADDEVKKATARDILRITMDHDDSLLFWDYDRIRRINVDADRLPSEGTQVTTIIGGPPGGTRDEDCLGNGQDALNVTKICVNVWFGTSLWATPNGDIYFNSYHSTTTNAGFALRRYRAGIVDTIPLGGNGFYSYYPASSPDVAENTVSTRTLQFTWIMYDYATSALKRIFSFVYNDATYGYGIATFGPTGMTTTPQMGSTSPPGYLHATLSPFVGMDGNLYTFDLISSRGLYRYDLTNNEWDRLIGTGTASGEPCPVPPSDPGLANTCDIDPQDAFVDAAGHIYWTSFGRIFTLTEDNKVLRIMGQGYDFGNNGPPLAARFGHISSFDMWRDDDDRDRLVTADSINIRYRETTFNNGIDDGPLLDAQENKIVTIAGNGRNGYAAQLYRYTWDGVTLNETEGADATTRPTRIERLSTMRVDPQNGFVYMGMFDFDGEFRLVRLRRDRATPQWEGFAGGGATPYYNATDPTLGRDIDITNTFEPQVHLIHNGKVIYRIFFQIASTFHHSMLKLFTTDPHVSPPPPVYSEMTHLSGVTGSVTQGTWCENGSARQTCHNPIFYNASRVPGVYDPGNGGSVKPRWLIGSDWNNLELRAFEEDPATGTVYSVANMPLSTRSFTFRREEQRAFLYYCAGDGRIVRRQLEPTVSSNVVLTWRTPVLGGVPTIECKGNAMRYDPLRFWAPGKTGTLQFSYEQYGLFGVAEYYDPLLAILSPPTLPSGTVSTPYSHTLVAANGKAPLVWSVINGSVPSGLTLQAGGLLSGNPSSSGPSSFVVRVTDANNTTHDVTFSLTIAP